MGMLSSDKYIIINVLKSVIICLVKTDEFVVDNDEIW